MAAQKCPKCEENSFLWFFNEKSNITSWSCYNCDYEAKEISTEELVCQNCNEKTKKKLKDKEKEYWWCSSCNNTVEV